MSRSSTTRMETSYRSNFDNTEEWTIMADEFLLSIEKLVYGGDGLARTEENTVLVPFVLPGEQVTATVPHGKRS